MSILHESDSNGAPNPGPGFDYPSAEPSPVNWDEDEVYARARPTSLRLFRAVSAIIVLALICFVGYRGASSWFGRQLDPSGEPGEAVTLIIPSGSTVGDIGSILEANEVIPNSTFFRYYVQWGNQDEEFKAGEYTLGENMSADEAIAVLREGPKQIEYGEFLVREGLWVNEMLPVIADQIPGVTTAELETALASGQIEPRYRPEGQESWEGLLFPAKYFIEEDIGAVEVLSKMSNEFASVAGELGYGGAERKHGYTAYEVIIIASLVEAEARTPGDRSKIARVIYNRLQRGIPIGIDATYIFGAGDRKVPLTRSFLNEPGPYNSRDNLGLPPTPIAAPGRASLEAAMNPAANPPKGCTDSPETENEGDCDLIFYVLADAEGNHFFTHSHSEFLAQKDASIAAGLIE